MGRKAVLFGFWITGYVLGIIAWTSRTPFLQFIQSLGFTAEASQGLLAGLFGSIVMVLTVLLWSFLSSSR